MLNFLSWNVNGLKNKIHDVKEELRHLDPDVVFLQETRISESNSKMLNDSTYQCFLAPYSSRCRGVAVLVKRAKIHKDSEPKVDSDDNRCYILVNINICGEKYNLVSVYNAKGDTRLLSNLSGILKNRNDGVLVIGGDFNTALNPEIDCNNFQRKDKKSNENLQKFIKILKLKDTWRVKNPTEKKYTYVVQSRIDYLFVPETDAVSINECEIKNSRISNHNPVSLTLSLNFFFFGVNV
uniref:exodeoxyribonuclease III n=1 Tax=Astyanax mexicanus TaxID=7994 RepID=A0A8B9RPM4_ASTMX